MAKEALLIIDMLNDFILEGAPLEVPATREIMPAVKREIDRARAEGNPVIYVCDAHDSNDREFSKFGWPAHAVSGTKGAHVFHEISPHQDDVIVKKTSYSGFYKSDLDNTLKHLGIEHVRLTGCVTHICVMFTASDAVLRDYRVTVVEDAVAGLTEEDHDAAIRIMKNVLGVNIV